MTIRKINFTNRLKIERDQVIIRTKHEGTAQYRFDVDFHLDDLQLPADSQVILEAYYQTERKRFNFGSIEKIAPPLERSLAQFASFSGINFRLLIVSVSENKRRILGVADRLRPAVDSDEKSVGLNKLAILPVEVASDISEAWQINFGSDEPVLILNERLNNVRKRLEDDALFRLMLFPQILRRVLNRMVYVDKVQIEDLEGPYSKWIRFIHRFAKDEQNWPEMNVEDTRFDAGQVDDWIEGIVEKVCDFYHLVEKASS